MAIRANLRAALSRLKHRLVHLNLFDTGSQDETIIRNELRSTRVYLFLFIISITILTLTYSIISYTTTIVVPSPSLVEYSNLIEKPTLQCFCSNTTVKYEKFAHIKPHYHELCESEFVSDDWIKHLYFLYEQSWNKSVRSDFRRTSVFQFQTLRSLCQLAKDTINHSLQSFDYTDFVGSELVPQNVFEVQINSCIRDFIEKIPQTFLQTLQFIQDTTAQSLFMTGASITSVQPDTQQVDGSHSGIYPYPGINYTFTDGSSCVCSSSTATNCMGMTIFENTTVSGFQTGCYMLSALMNSTLEAFYNQTLIDKLANASKTFRKLDSSNPNEKIDVLLSKMFVEIWCNTTSFENYFQNCAPDSCSYTVTQGYSFWDILIILFSLFGALISVLTFLSPILVLHVWPFIAKFIFRRRVPVAVETRPVSSICTKIRRLFQFIKKTLINLNLFASVPPSQDETILRRQRYQTRLYIIISLATLIILIFSISMNSHRVNVTIENPSLTTFDKLDKQFSSTLNCPCNQTILEYHQFILDLKPQHHEICASDFISRRWIDLQLITSSYKLFYTNDIHYQSAIHFQLLSTLCRVAQQTVDDHLQSFYQTKFITNQVLRNSSFQTQIDSIIEQFKRILAESYNRTIQVITANSEINQFVVPLNSLFKDSGSGVSLEPATNVLRYKVENGSSVIYHTCVWLLSNECVLETIIRNNDFTEIIPGMIQTVFPLQSVLLSTLECFYNETCLSKITNLIDSKALSTKFSTLRLSLLSDNESQYDKIEILVNKLFIQSWPTNQSSYESYFNQCHPLTCQYSYESRFSLVYAITTLAGLSAGLKFYAVMNYIKKTMTEFNLFHAIPPSQDPKILRRNRRLTRIYLVLLIMFFYILAVYTVLAQETVLVIDKNPSVSKYSELSNQYHRTLKCPCSHIAVKYDQFITLDPQYHPICSSALIAYEKYNITWPKNSDPGRGFLDDVALDFGENDFRLWIAEQLMTVSRMCILSRNILNASLSSWLQGNLITGNVISSTEFRSQTKALISAFKRTTVNEFKQTFDLIQVTNYANQLATAQSSNWQFIKQKFNQFSPSSALTIPQMYNDTNCSCALQSNCSTLNSFPYRTSNQSLKLTLPGFRSGCLFLNALLQSDFTCFYNKTCLYLMQTASYHLKSVPFQIFNVSSSSSSPNQTIENILGQLFIEEWKEQESFKQYYNACAPQFCQYSYSSKFNGVYFVTTILAAFGGLTKILHFAKNRVIPQSDTNVIDVNDHTPEIAISNLPVTTVEINTNPIQEQIEPRPQKRIKRAIMICGCLLVIVGIVIVSVNWFKSASTQHILTTESTTLMANMVTKESTTTSTESCYLTLTIHSEAYPVGSDAKSLILGDFNKDSFLDLAVANYKNHTISVLLGNGNGKFRVQKIYSTGDESYPLGITSGDFNNDTFLDIAVALSKQNEIAILFGNRSNGLFDIKPHTVATSGNDLDTLTAIEAIDLNDDGFTDLVVGNQRHIPPGFNINSWFPLLNLGDGNRYRHYSTYSHFISNIESIVIGDFNNDGKANDISLCSSNGVVSTFSAIQYVGTIMEKYQYVENRIYGKPQSMIRGRFNDDEFDDLALISPQTDTLHVLLAYGDGTFTQQIYHSPHNPVSVAAINFNNDPIDDLAVLSCNQTIRMYLGTKNGIFHENDISFYVGENSTNECYRSLRSADLNKDGRDDLVFIDVDSQAIRVLLGTSCKEHI
ncbi:unnamed protein product [Adineta steineri]|uniref:Uncharacterized protein n=1 Tax=Adineta steineri TaxID=433720 RepID=A0A815C102_9BILA|nr:unnamed protein product [Adineta steineri]CAF1461543.1 unnamed protein product [Adineta steineri]